MKRGIGMEKYQFTNRVNRIFHIARKEAECSDHIIQPLHLLSEHVKRVQEFVVNYICIYFIMLV